MQKMDYFEVKLENKANTSQKKLNVQHDKTFYSKIRGTIM